MLKFRSLLPVICILSSALSPTADAHHSVANYDLSDAKRGEIAGTVKKFEWQNPHSWVWIEVPNKNGESETWAMELSSPGALRRAGLSWDSFKAGDKVTVTYCPMRDGRKAGLLTKAKWADGRSWEPSGQASPLPPSGQSAPGQQTGPVSSAPPLTNKPPQ